MDTIHFEIQNCVFSALSFVHVKSILTVLLAVNIK